MGKGKCGNDCGECRQSCLDCNGEFELWVKNKKSINIHTFKPYFDVTLGKEVTSEKEIKDYCKQNNCVYAGDKELTQQCESNKRYNEQKFNRQFENGLKETILRSLN